jgi:hypothetical protein
MQTTIIVRNKILKIFFQGKGILTGTGSLMGIISPLLEICILGSFSLMETISMINESACNEKSIVLSIFKKFIFNPGIETLPVSQNTNSYSPILPKLVSIVEKERISRMSFKFHSVN